jgi:hypothetical protein
MTNEEMLLSEGAYYFGSRMIYKNQDIGVTAPGASLVLLPEGEELVTRLSNITDVVAKPARAARTPKAVEDAVVVDKVAE